MYLWRGSEMTYLVPPLESLLVGAREILAEKEKKEQRPGDKNRNFCGLLLLSCTNLYFSSL